MDSNLSVSSMKVPKRGQEVKLQQKVETQKLIFETTEQKATNISSPTKTEVNPEKFDYSNFKSNDRMHAFQHLENTLNDVKKIVEHYNKQHPEAPYNIDYSTLPNPKIYDKKVHDTKDNAYSAWADKLNNWKNDIIDTVLKKDAEESQKAQDSIIKQQIDGLKTIYMTLGISIKSIEKALAQTNNNIIETKKILDQKLNKIAKQNNNLLKETKDIKGNNDSVYKKLEELEQSDQEIKDNIKNAEYDIKNNIRREANAIKENTNKNTQFIYDNNTHFMPG